MRLQLEVAVRRGAIVEARHRIQAAVVDAEGRLIAATEAPGEVTTFRSGAKPFQLLPLVERGHAERFGFRDEELAVMAASHTGSAHHLRLVSGILDRLGLAPQHLACGYHDPDDPESRAALFGGSVPRSALYNNCSGKHAGLLALAIAEGWPVEGYHLAGHPVQQAMLRSVADLCGVTPESVRTAVDGCGVVVFALPLSAMARGYAALVAASSRPDGTERERALHRIARAMTQHPYTVEGAGRTSTALMEATAGRLLAKCGAEGLQMVGVMERGIGVALKCEDGATRAVAPALVALLETLGFLSSGERLGLAALFAPRVLNAAGVEVGCLEPELRVVASL